MVIKRRISIVFRNSAEEEISVGKRFIFFNSEKDYDCIHITEEQKRELLDIAIWFVVNREYRFELYRNEPCD